MDNGPSAYDTDDAGISALARWVTLCKTLLLLGIIFLVIGLALGGRNAAAVAGLVLGLAGALPYTVLTKRLEKRQRIRQQKGLIRAI